ncbi:MAG: PBECR2 nuclease fold domain-containing protein [Acidobacteriota bacterium]
MPTFEDVHGRSIRVTEERLEHLETSHPEMREQLERLKETLRDPERVVRSRTDPDVELFYRRFGETPVTEKFLCAVVKSGDLDAFLVTAYFTDSAKRGDMLWERT